jgi:CRISPR-associated protein Csx17
MPNQIVLNGCTPEPLSSYLKALGVLRLIVEQGKDRDAKGSWQIRGFVLETQLSPDELELVLSDSVEATEELIP